MAVSGTWSVGIPWTALEEILACLHGATSEIDFNLHAYTLLQVQGLYRQAVCGKAGRACFRSADTHDCPLVNLAGGKSDQYDEHVLAREWHAILKMPNFVSRRRLHAIFFREHSKIIRPIYSWVKRMQNDTKDN